MKGNAGSARQVGVMVNQDASAASATPRHWAQRSDEQRAGHEAQSCKLDMAEERLLMDGDISHTGNRDWMRPA